MRQRGSSWHIALVTLGNLSSPIVALVTAPLLAQGLGVVARGELAAATAPLFLAAAALTLGLPDAVTHFTARFSRYARRSFLANWALLTVVGVAGTVLVFLLAPPLSGGSDELRDLIRICGTALTPALWVGIGRGFARGLQRWSLVVAEQIVSSTVKLVGVVALLATGNLSALSASILLSAALSVGGLTYLVIIPLLHPGAPLEPHRRIVGFGLSVWPGVLAGVVLSRLDQTLILPLSSAAALGVYAVAVSIADSARVFNIAVRDVIFARESASRDDEALALASRLSTLITVAMAGAVAGASFLVVVPLFGVEFASVPLVVSIILLGTVLGNPGSVLAAGISARGRPWLRSIAIMTGVAVNVVLLLLLVPVLGAVGAATAAAVANALTGLMVVVIAWRVFEIPPSKVLRPRASDTRRLWELVSNLRRR